MCRWNWLIKYVNIMTSYVHTCLSGNVIWSESKFNFARRKNEWKCLAENLSRWANMQIRKKSERLWKLLSRIEKARFGSYAKVYFKVEGEIKLLSDIAFKIIKVSLFQLRNLANSRLDPSTPPEVYNQTFSSCFGASRKSQLLLHYVAKTRGKNWNFSAF